MATEDTEKFLKDVARVKNIRDEKGRWVQKAKRYYPKQEREERQAQIARMKNQLRQPAWVNDALGGSTPASLAKGIRAMEDELEENSPPVQLPGDTKDALHKRHAELREQLREGMLTHEDMRRNPPGAVDHHRKWERMNKDKILEYKNISRALEPESDAKDLASIEVFRPSGGPAFSVDAQIPGHMAYTSVPQKNWDQTFGKKKDDSTAKKEATPQTLFESDEAPQTKAPESQFGDD